MTALVAPTLGPVARTVAVAPIIGDDPPEVLDDAATIVRRTIEIDDPFENAGAMLARQLVLEVTERAGDGGATTAVLARALLHEAGRLVAGGVNVVKLCQGIRQGLGAVVAALEAAAWRIDRPEEIASVALHGVGDPTLADVIAEILDTVGPEGVVLVEDSRGTTTTHEYLDGVRWDGGYLSAHLLAAGEATARVLEPRILLTDQELARPEQVVPALEACIAAGAPRLVVVAPEVRDAVIATLAANRERGVLDAALAIRAPSIGSQRTRILEDLAALTGGRCFRAETGDALERATLADLGSARQVWATRQAFGVLGGRGDRAAVRQRVTEVRAELASVQDDPYLKSKVRERLAKLTGTGATIQVGGPTRRAQELLRQRIEATVTTTQLALAEGVVPGGGTAPLLGVPPLERLGLTGDAAAGARVLARALAAPARVIARNAGLDGRAIAHHLLTDHQGETFDVVRQAWAEPRASGLADPLGVSRAALEAAVSAATTALTVEVLIRRRDPLRRIRS